MKPRHKRIAAIALGVAALGIAAALVLAKHDENYMPPEAAEAVKRAQEKTSKTLLIPDKKP